jgi:hypothetical protein
MSFLTFVLGFVLGFVLAIPLAARLAIRVLHGWTDEDAHRAHRER